jgi:hypothetical protein
MAVAGQVSGEMGVKRTWEWVNGFCLEPGAAFVAKTIGMRVSREDNGGRSGSLDTRPIAWRSIAAATRRR